MELFLIYVENGEYDYRYVQQMYLVTSEELAEQLVIDLEKASECYNKFQRNECEAWITDYILNVPQLVRTSPIERPKRYMPTPPADYRDLPKKEKKKIPEYCAFIKAYKEYEAQNIKIREEDRKIEDNYSDLYNDWGKKKEIALKKYKQEYLVPKLEESFSECTRMYAQKMIKYIPGDTFNYKKIQVLQ